MDIFVPPADVISSIIFSVIAFFLLILVAYLLTRDLESTGSIASLLVLGSSTCGPFSW